MITGKINYDKVEFDDPNMKKYFNSLSAETQASILESGAEIFTLDQLMESVNRCEHRKCK